GRAVGTDVPSRLSALLTEALPGLPTDADCWAAKVIAHDPAGMTPLSAALDVVAAHVGQLEIVRRRIRREHPLRRAHRREYDDGLLDALTEACAFAWAAGNPALGVPELTSAGKGTPDV